MSSCEEEYSILKTYRFGYWIDESHKNVLLLSCACNKNIHLRVGATILELGALTIGVEQLQAILDAIVGLCRIRLRVLLDEANEGGALDLDGLPGAIVERNHKMKEIRFAQIAGRLLLKVGAANAKTAIRRRKMSL